MYKEVLAYPYTGMKELLINFSLFLIPFINVITGFFVFGYFISAVQGSVKNNLNMPLWQRSGHLFVSGFKLVIIGLVYSIPFFLVGLLGRINPTLGLSVTIVVGLLTLFIFPSVIVRYAVEDRFAAGFEFAAIVKAAFTAPMAQAWGVAVLIFVGYAAAAMILAILTAITYVGPYVVFIFALVAYVLSTLPMFARAYKQVA
jgi:hypothetical protein